MKNWKRIILPGVIALLFPLMVSNEITKAMETNTSAADTAIRAFNDMFWDSEENFFWFDSNQDSHQGFWVEAELWEMVMDAYLNTSDPTLKEELRTQIDDVFDGTVEQYGEEWTDNPFNDDIMWWALGSARAYEITEDERYLETAKYHFDYVYENEWDDDFANGGIWWKSDDRSTKNACINFPAVQTAIQLYHVTGEEEYLETALQIFHWGKTMLTDGDGKVFDRIEVENGTIPHATHYNQGTFIGAAVGLYHITGDEVYLEDAVKAAQFTIEELVDGNDLLRYEGPNLDLKGGKTILIRNLAYLQDTLNELNSNEYEQFTDEFNYWLTYNTVNAWDQRGEDNVVDGNWSGQLLSGTYESWSSSGAVQALQVIETYDYEDVELIVETKDAFETIEAEDYNIGSGFLLEGSPEGGLQLAGIEDEDYAVYKNVDFGSTEAVGFIARMASGTDGGNIEIRLDSLDGPVIGNLDAEGTGGWQNFTDMVSLLEDEEGNRVSITGKHDIYLVFNKKEDDYLFNLNWFTFTTSDPTKTHAFTRLNAEDFGESTGLSINAESGYVENIEDGAYALYGNINFGSGAAGITVHAAGGSQGGSIEIKLDSLDGPTAGVIDIPAIGDWDKWVDIMATVDEEKATGIHDVYLVFHGNDGDYPFNIDWFSFSAESGQDRDAYAKLEAENYNSGAEFGTETGGGETYLAGINADNQPYAMYNYIDFGDTSPEQFHVRAASDTNGGTIEVRIDSMDGPVIANIPVTGTGGWQNFETFSTNIATPVTGEHIVFFHFKGEGFLYNFDKFTFGDPAVFTEPDPQPEPEEDDVPPGEVENVRIIRSDEEMKLYWDGPYDMDGEKVQITLLKDGQAIGDMMEVKRGIQKATFTDLEKDEAYSLSIRAVDTSDNVSEGILLHTKDFASFTLTAGDASLEEDTSFEDYQPVIFQVLENESSIKTAAIVIDGQTYKLDATETQTLEIDMAGNLGEKVATVITEDESGNRLIQTFHFSVMTNADSLGHLLTRFIESEEISGPLVPQLSNTMDQVHHMLGKDKQKQAKKHLQRFVRHLNNETLSQHIDENAKEVLNTDAGTLLDSW